MTVLVTGATGTVGRQVVRSLLDRGRKVRALTRDPARADLPEDVEVIRGDLADAGGLEAAFDGATAAHLITFGEGYRPLANGRDLVDLAERAGVGKVTVLAGWQEGTLEPAVRASGGLEWTFLEPVQFMANFLADWGEPLRTTGRVREPYGDRQSPPVDEHDIGAVAATVLTQDGHGGRSYHLTGPEVLTARRMVGIIAEVTGRDLRFEELTPEQVRREWSVPGAGRRCRSSTRSRRRPASARPTWWRSCCRCTAPPTSTAPCSPTRWRRSSAAPAHVRPVGGRARPSLPARASLSRRPGGRGLTPSSRL
ncbi:SDR family oxidoreductase [Nonomuraea thailandensis]